MSKKAINKMKKEARGFWLMAAFAILGLFFGAIWQINFQTHQKTLLADFQKKIAAISSENDALEAKLSQTNSWEDFGRFQSDQLANYEKVDISAVRYVRVPAGELAKK